MDSDFLLALCNKFKVASMEEDPNKLLSLLSEDLKEPSRDDDKDLFILLNRAYKALLIDNITIFVETMIKIDKMVKQFMVEKFDPEFADFITDQDNWNYIYELKDKNSLSQQDKLYLNILKNELLYLSSKTTLLI